MAPIGSQVPLGSGPLFVWRDISVHVELGKGGKRLRGNVQWLNLMRYESVMRV